MKKKILFGLGIFLIVAQFIRIDKENPTSDPGLDILSNLQAPVEVKSLMKKACYDCHSNHTKYPWYTDIAPVSWWIKGHINGARESLNFSNWAEFSQDKKQHVVEESVIKIENEWMPLGSYVWLHPEAKLSQEDRDLLVKWFNEIL